MATIKPISVPAKRLNQTISGSASSFKLDNILGWDGSTNLASSDFGTKAYAVFRNSAGTLIEFMEIDPSTIASSSITILRRGLKYNGDDLTTEVSANKLTWVKGDTIVELGSHPPQLLAHYVDIVGDQTIAGTKTFSAFPEKSGSTTPTSAAQFATKAYVDLIGTGSAIYDQNIITGTAGETLAAGEVIYFKSSDQRWWKADADLTATFNELQLGIAQAAATAGNSVNILIAGVEKNLSGLTAGSDYYLSGTAGAVVTPAPSGKIPVFIGRATSTTRLVVDFRQIDMAQKKQVIDGSLVYGAPSGGTDAYAITVSPAPIAYTAGMKFVFKTDVANTGAATLNVNSLGAVTIKKLGDQDLATGDIEAGQIVEVVYDGTNFQMLSQLAIAAQPKFGGDGSDGALNVTSGTTNIDLGSATLVVKNYSSINVSAGATLGFTNPASKGTVVILRSQGNVTIAGTVTGNFGSAGGAATTDGSDSDDILDTSNHYGGAGVVNVTTTGGAGGTGGATFDITGVTPRATPYTTAVTYLYRRNLLLQPGAGGGGGATNSLAVAGGVGGRGGGALLIECAGAWDFTGTINMNGTAGSVGTSTPGSGDSGSGGGGGGGMLVALYNSLTASSGTVTYAGGAGADGPARSGDNFGSGGGGAGGGAVAGAGGNGGAGGSGTNAGSNGTAGGGASGGAAGTAATSGSGTGGGAGGGGGTGSSLITKNLWFA